MPIGLSEILLPLLNKDRAGELMRAVQIQPRNQVHIVILANVSFTCYDFQQNLERILWDVVRDFQSTVEARDEELADYREQITLLVNQSIACALYQHEFVEHLGEKGCDPKGRACDKKSRAVQTESVSQC